MKIKVVVLSSLALLMFWMTAPVWAQAFPYEGVVTGSNVYVRSGPNTGSYPVAKLSAPDRVTVVAELSNDWLAVQPVRGCYGVISAQYVQPDATGKIGTINGDAVLVRAAGELRTRDFDNPLGKRNRGDRVRIIGKVVGTDGKVEWYVIKPPADMRFYIAAQFIRPADGSTPPEAQDQEQDAEQDETVEMVPPKSDESTAAETKKTQSIADQPAVGAPVRQDLDALHQIRALEKEIMAESAKPLEQRNYSSIMARAEKINMPKASRFYPIYESMMEYLREEVTIVEGTRETDQMVDDILRKAAEKSAGAKQPYQPSPAKEPAADQFEGLVTVSALYTIADPSKTSRYVIRDPVTMAVVGYIQSSSGKVYLKNYVNKHVRVTGKEVYDDSISMKILEVETITPTEPPATPARQPEPVEPTTPKAAPAPTEPEPEPEAVTPAVKPAPAKVATPKAAEPEPAKEPVTPVKKAAPVVVATPKAAEPEPAAEPVAPVIKATPAKVTTPKAIEPEPEPKLTEATEPEPEEPTAAEPAPAKEPEPEVVAVPKAVEPEPAAPAEPEEVTPVKEPAPEEVAQPEPEDNATELEPVATKKAAEPEPAEEVAAAEPEAAAEPVSAQPIAPKKVAPIDVEPMKIEAAHVAPADVEAPELPAEVTAAKASSSRAKAASSEPAPAEVISEPEMKTYEVQATEGEVEVEWD